MCLLNPCCRRHRRYRPSTVTELLVEGKAVGTLFVRNPLPEPEVSTKVAARAARTASRQLQALGPEGRAAILHAMAAALLEHKDRILAANAVDVGLAAASDMSDAMRARLVRVHVLCVCVCVCLALGAELTDQLTPRAPPTHTHTHTCACRC